MTDPLKDSITRALTDAATRATTVKLAANIAGTAFSLEGSPAVVLPYVDRVLAIAEQMQRDIQDGARHLLQLQALANVGGEPQ